MRIHVLSDLHMEFGYTSLDLEIADLLIIAGDLHVKTKGINWLLEHVKNTPVIYILGNHEYYRGSYPKTLHQIKDLARGSNVHVLENESVTIKNITFHGTTLWTDFELFGDPRVYGALCQEKLNDYKLIRRDPSYSKLRSIDTYKLHKYSLHWLEQSLSRSASALNVVVTHHAPSIQSLPDKFRADPISSAYTSNLEEFILKYQPTYWIHGHIHTPCRYSIGSCQVLCNPHGYMSKAYNGFEKALTIQLPE